MRSGIGPACLLMALVGALLVAGCGGDDGGSPEDTVNDYLAAARDDDFEGACDFLSSDSIEAIEATGATCPETFDQFGAADDVPEEIEIGEVTEDGDNATVEAIGDGETVEVPLVNEDGEWKVDFTAAPPESSR